ncbi:unnamed protein product [Camellia sinensis]
MLNPSSYISSTFPSIPNPSQTLQEIPSNFPSTPFVWSFSSKLMEGSKNFLSLIAIISAAMLVISVKGQLGTPCTTSMVSSFTPCLNYITGSSSSGVSPATGCCDAVKSLMSGSMDCACLIVTGNVPFSLPINRTLAISLPQACKSSGGLPLQCKASGVPLPAPGTTGKLTKSVIQFGPTSSPLSPDASAPFSPTASKAAEMASPPVDDTTTPASPPVSLVAPKATPGIRPVVTPTSISASNPSYNPSPFVLLVFIGIIYGF